MNTFELIFNSNTFNDFLIKSLLLFFFGFTIRQCLVLCGQRWANTYHHLATYLLLPNIALMITSVIKNDIALSLGMIGALSIVRFRTPIKEPEELGYLFFAIAIGLGMGAGYKLVTTMVSIIILIYLYVVSNKKSVSKIDGEYSLVITLKNTDRKSVV